MLGLVPLVTLNREYDYSTGSWKGKDCGIYTGLMQAKGRK